MRSQLHITWRDLLDWMRHCERRTKGARVVVPHHLTGQAHHRYDAIAPLLEFRRTRGLASRRGAEGGGREVINMDQIAQSQALKNKVSARTIWRWYARFSGGYAELADRPRRDKGVSRRFDQSPNIRAFVEKEYLESRQSFSGVHRSLLRQWTRLRGDSEEAPPCYATMRNYLKSLPKLVLVLARHGELKFERACGRSCTRVIRAVEEFTLSKTIN